MRVMYSTLAVHLNAFPPTPILEAFVLLTHERENPGGRMQGREETTTLQ